MKNFFNQRKFHPHRKISQNDAEWMKVVQQSQVGRQYNEHLPRQVSSNPASNIRRISPWGRRRGKGELKSLKIN